MKSPRAHICVANRAGRLQSLAYGMDIARAGSCWQGAEDGVGWGEGTASLWAGLLPSHHLKPAVSNGDLASLKEKRDAELIAMPGKSVGIASQLNKSKVNHELQDSGLSMA